MKQLRRLLLLVVGMGLAVGPVAPGLAQEDVIKERQKLMKSVGKATKTMGEMLQGKVPYDAAAAVAAMETIAGVPAKFVKLFPEDSAGDPDSKAADAIWEDMARFQKLAASLEKDAKAGASVAGNGPDALKGAFVKLTENCKACHKDFRLEDN